MTIIRAKEELKALQEKLSAFDHAASLISYDGATGAPRGTAANRAQTLGILGEERYKLAVGPETAALLELLEANRQELTQSEERQVTLLIKSVRELKQVPMEEYVAYQRLLVEADDVWHRAKLENDFASFRPYLEKIFDTTRRFAGYFAPEKDPYEYWLGEFEEGLTVAACDAFFEKVRQRLVPLLQKIAAAPQVDDSLLSGDFPEEAQKALAEYLMELMGLDRDQVGLATTEHPFTTSLGSHFDVRITTHYHRDNLASSMYSVIHEGGHALYDTGSRPELAYTVLDGGVSMGIHESQSRFYENIIGRSRPFVELVFPKIQELFPSLGPHTAEEFYRAVNKAEPSLIRTEADEITYCLHVMVRYELEKRVMAGDLTVADLPAAWNALYKEYLGVDVPDDTRGVLQDSHWAGGAIGYFPSYALGSAYGAQFFRKMKETVEVESRIAAGDFGPVNGWNREHIWQHGCLFTPPQLLARVLEGPFDPEVYLTYLEEKAADVYGI